MKHEKIYIYGKHALMEALEHAPHALGRVYLDTRVKEKELRAKLEASNILVSPLSRDQAGNLAGKTSHQGMIGLLKPSMMFIGFDAFADSLRASANTLLVYLDQVQDPHNVGAIIRSAAAFGASGVLMPRQKQALLTPAVVKASAGMVFRVPLVECEEPDKALSQLHKKGFKIYGLAGEGREEISQEEFQSPTVLLFGNEGEGLSGRARAHCDSTLAIPMHPRAESLNVAAAAAVAMHAWSGRHSDALSQD